MKSVCRNCKKDAGGNKFCSARCKWTWHNHNRTLTPNVVVVCESCGKEKRRWISPARLAEDKNQGRFCSRKCAGKWRRGDNHPNWNGGRLIDRDGYVLVYAPEHPQASARGYVREHRLIMESHLGRRLRRREVVHHVNDDPQDNRIENLRLYPSNKQHKSDDAKQRQRDERGRLLPKGGR